MVISNNYYFLILREYDIDGIQFLSRFETNLRYFITLLAKAVRILNTAGFIVMNSLSYLWIGRRSCRNWYLSLLITCPKYCSLRLLVVIISSLSFRILHTTSTFVTLFVHGILSILRYIHISNTSILLVSIFFNAHASIQVKLSDNLLFH